MPVVSAAGVAIAVFHRMHQPVPQGHTHAAEAEDDQQSQGR
ncbi:MAG: hypothetical protein AAGI71_06525 [Bacteroidota bacterium]